jgi:uncharacterized GH25 family protein
MRESPFQDKRLCICSLLLLLVSTVAAAKPSVPKATTSKTTVRGVVVDDKGKPVAGASVHGVVVLTHRQGEAITMGNVPVPQRQTDERGAFTLELTGAKTDLTLRLSARHENAFTARAVELQGDDLEKPITLKVSPQNARALRVHVVDEDGKPVAGVGVVVWHRPSAPRQLGQGENKPVDLPRDAGRATDRAGRFQTPPCLDPDGSYQMELKAEGFLAEQTAWKEMPAKAEIVFEATLRRLRPLEGEVIDRQGKAVAGARVVHSHERQKVETVTDEKGHFQMKTAFFPPGFLFVSKSGFRFHGQRCDRSEPLKITLTRREENAVEKMTTLPPALPRAARKELAAKVLEPLLQRARKEEDGGRSRPLQALGRLDAGRLLAELDRQPMQSAWFDAYVRRAAVQGLKDEAPEEACAIIESMKDADFRSQAYLDLCDGLPNAKKAEKRALLHQALVQARSIAASDHRVIQLAWVARRLWLLDDKALAAKLLREGQEIARELPTAGWSGYARGAFAEDLALIDLDAALALMKDLKDNFEFIRHHGNLAQKLAGSDPAAAERVFGLLLSRNDGQAIYQRDQYAPRVCHRMAPVDLARARKIADTVNNPYFKARSYGVMAQALARKRPDEARELLDRAFDVLEKHVASGQDNFNNFWDAASLAGLMVSAAEDIDASLVPEFFWRALSLRNPPRRGGAEDEWRRSQEVPALGALALVLARYDRDIAMAFVEEASKRTPGRNAYQLPHLRAAALADPRRAVVLIEALPEEANKDYLRLTVVNMLVAEGDTAWKSVHGALAQWFVTDEDL